MRRWLALLLAWLCAFWLLLGSPSYLPQVAVGQTTNGYSDRYIDRIMQITFGSMPPATEGGSVNIPGFGTISWQAGQTLDQFLPLGLFYDSFNLQLFSLQQIADLAGIDLGGFNLDNLPLFRDLTFSGLLAVIPDLQNWNLPEIPALYELVTSILGNDPTPWEELTLSELLSVYENLGSLRIDRIDLSKYGLDAIPGLLDTPLALLPDWEKTIISEIPGLKDVPFAKFPGIPTGPGNLALFDIAYGEAEARRVNTITGSNVEGFNVPCNEDSCPYIELSGPPWLNAQELHGKQWIVGGGDKGQKVKGGSGLLAVINGGQEPTGRHPFGPGFKVVLEETVEKEGSGRFAIYFRYCTTFGGCTPYFIGPIPWFVQHEGDIIFVGLNYTAQPPPGTPTHPGLPPGIALPPGALPPPDPVPPGQPDKRCELYKGVSIPALKSTIASIESAGAGYKAIGNYVCDRNGLCGRALGKYQFMTYKEILRSQVLSNPGGAEFLRRANVNDNSDTYKQQLADELLQYFPSQQQEALFEAHIKKAIDQADNEQRQGRIPADGIIERIGKIHNAGEGSSPTPSPYGQEAKEKYDQAKSQIDKNCPEVGGCAGRFINPTPGAPVTSEFGMRWGRMHEGIDLGVPTGTAVLASDGGKAIYAGPMGTYGNTIDILHCDGKLSRYAHNSRLLVVVGQEVAQGQVIAYSGATGGGRLTGPHLHFEIRLPPAQTAVNPRTYVSF